MESKRKRRKEKSTWTNDCMIKSHTPLQCFSPPSSVPPLISLPLHLLHLYKAECRHHPAHTNTRAHTPPRHLSVQRPVSLALGAVGSKRVKGKKCLSAPSSRIPLPLFVPPPLCRCLSNGLTTSRCPPMGPSPTIPTLTLDAIWRTIKLLEPHEQEEMEDMCRGVFQPFRSAVTGAHFSSVH